MSKSLNHEIEVTVIYFHSSQAKKLSQTVLLISSYIKISSRYNTLLYDWREPGLLIGPICLHKSLCLPGNWSEPVCKLILRENQLELVSRS